MTKNYRILLIVCSVLLCLLFVSCKSEDTAIFPMDDSGYPQKTVVLINGKTYELPNRELAFTAEQSEVLKTVVEVKVDDKLEVSLAQGTAVCKWVVEQKIGLTVKEGLVNLGTGSNTIGGCSGLQVFEMTAADNVDEIILKWVNCNELEKEFKDMQEYYCLTIKIK